MVETSTEQQSPTDAAANTVEAPLCIPRLYDDPLPMLNHRGPGKLAIKCIKILNYTTLECTQSASFDGCWQG